jgi:hypothetical protein
LLWEARDVFIKGQWPVAGLAGERVGGWRSVKMEDGSVPPNPSIGNSDEKDHRSGVESSS